jgi:hypothetical protein
MPGTISPAWTMTGLEARCGNESIDLAAPAGGLALPGGGHLLGLDLRTTRGDPRLVDHWVRGDDLVAVYEPADPRRLRATAVWRPFPGGRAAWEVVLSAQTSLVESDSSLAVTVDLVGSDIRWGRLAEGGVRWSPAAEPGCPPDATCLLATRDAAAALVAVHPADARQITVHNVEGRTRIACWLFSTLIEKGVLLRSRVLAATGPSGDDAWATDLAVAFAASPPPLTT